MNRIKRLAIFAIMAGFLASASFAQLHFGGETSIGIASDKLFGTAESKYLYPLIRTLGSWHLSAFIGVDSGLEDSVVAVGAEQHFGVQVASIFAVDHLPLIFSLPTRAYVRFGTSDLALDVLAGIDNQIILTGSGSYPAYISTDYLAIPASTNVYSASRSGYAMGLELGFRLVVKHSYFLAIAALPITDNYMFPGLIRLGFGLTF